MMYFCFVMTTQLIQLGNVTSEDIDCSSDSEVSLSATL